MCNANLSEQNWDKINDPDMESIMIDGTVVCAYSCAAGAPQSHLDEAQEQALGRSKGGLHHVMVMLYAIFWTSFLRVQQILLKPIL